MFQNRVKEKCRVVYAVQSIKAKPGVSDKLDVTTNFNKPVYHTYFVQIFTAYIF